MKDNEKVLDFIKSGGPKGTVDGTVFEMWLGGLSGRSRLQAVG